MSKKNTGKEYEKFIESIYKVLTKDSRFTSVEHDVYLDGKDGPRQIDVLLRSEVANIDLRIVIECRDYKSRIDITHLDGFHSKLMDVNASKGVLVSSKGFSKGARSKASRNGITLCLASDANSVLKEIEREVPVMARRIKAHLDMKFNIEIAKVGAQCNMFDVATDELDLVDKFHNELLSGDIETPDVDSQTEWWIPDDLNLPYPIKAANGNVVLKDLRVLPRFEISYYYGHLNDVPDLTAIHQYESDATTFLFKEKDYPNIIPALNEYKSKEEIPPNYQLVLNLVSTHFGIYSGKSF